MKIGWRSMISVLLLLAFGVATLAHGDKKHVMGTIERVSTQSVTVKTSDGKIVEVRLAEDTMYVTKDDKPAKFTDLAVGQRVVIHATPKGTDLVAIQVRFSPGT